MFSSLISGTVPHHDKFNRRPGKVTRAIQHHWADVTMGGEQSLASPRRRASVNYLIHNDGIIIGQVPEEFRPWTSSSSAADNPSITIEVQNQTGAPEWRVSDAARNSIARLLADIAKRHGFGSLNRTNYRGHREFAATACPGPYLYPRLQAICDAANAIHPGPGPIQPINPPNPLPPFIPIQEDDLMLIIESPGALSTLQGSTLAGLGTTEQADRLTAKGVQRVVYDSEEFARLRQACAGRELIHEASCGYAVGIPGGRYVGLSDITEVQYHQVAGCVDRAVSVATFQNLVS